MAVTVKAKWTLISYIKTFSYAGAAQTWTVPYTGNYKIELWGAHGNYGTPYNLSSSYSGYGGYVSGNVYISKNSNLYIYVGQQISANTTAAYNGGWNGGGDNTISADVGNNYIPGGGGGATDIRTISGDWNNINSLRSRIMVAGAGGGGSYAKRSDYTYYTKGGNAGGLSGYVGYGYYNDHSTSLDNSPTQTAGGAATIGSYAPGVISGGAGGFGYGGISYAAGCSTWNCSQGGAGSGWYGGGGGAHGAVLFGGGGGGSSYISGHAGSIAVTSSSNTSPKCSAGSTSVVCSQSWTGYTFTNTLMIDGAGYKWTNVKDGLQQMPNPNGGYYASGVGHSGNGFVRITYLGS